MANLKATNFLGAVFEKIGTSTVSGTTVTVDLATGNYFVLDLQGASGTIATFTISNVSAPSPKVRSFQTKIIQGSTARQFDWIACGGTASCSNPVYSNQSSCEAAGEVWGNAFKWQKYWLPGTGWVHRPTTSTTNDAVDVYSFTTYDNGTTWYSSIVGQDIK